MRQGTSRAVAACAATAHGHGMRGDGLLSQLRFYFYSFLKCGVLLISPLEDCWPDANRRTLATSTGLDARLILPRSRHVIMDEASSDEDQAGECRNNMSTAVRPMKPLAREILSKKLQH